MRALGTVKAAWVALLLILCFFVGWNLWAVLVDNRPTYGPDSSLFWSLKAYLTGSLGEGWQILLHSKGKGLLNCLFVLALTKPAGDLALAARLVSVLAHGATLWIVYALAVFVVKDRRAGLLAAVACGCLPLLVGFARLEYRDTLLATVVAGSLLLMLHCRLDRLWLDIALGLVLGLGIMTKLAFIPFMVAPGLWFVATRARSLRAWGHLLVVLLVMVGLVLPWTIINWAYIYENAISSSSFSDQPWQAKAWSYLTFPGNPILLALAAAAGPLLWFKGAAVRRSGLILLLLASFFSLGLFIFHFDDWPRYIIPVFPPAAVLAGAGLSWVLGQIRLAGLRIGLAAAGVALLLGLFGYYNLVPGSLGEIPQREYHLGMVAPDTRPYDGFPRAVALTASLGEALVVYDTWDTFGHVENLQVIELVWASRGVKLWKMNLDRARQHSSAGRPVPVLYIRRMADQRAAVELMKQFGPGVRAIDASQSVIQRVKSRFFWLHAQKTRRLLSTRSADGLTYEVLLVQKNRTRR
jgi:Dolichyl-phosphate-mannose-protein mannosyltransferase